jgi:hypothetical protein
MTLAIKILILKAALAAASGWVMLELI